jgi:two-component system, NtrC family, response regulator GlrR
MSKMHATSSAKVLLLNLRPSDEVRTTLGEILLPYLGLKAIECWPGHGCGDQVTISIGNLSHLISRTRPVLVFLVPAEDLTKQTRELLELMRKDFPAIPVMVLAEAGEPNEMFDWLKLGAADFLTVPLRAIDVLPRVWRLLERTDPGVPLLQSHIAKEGLNELVGESQKFLQEIAKIPSIAKCQASVLISGETGTGKELCARAIHYLSPRARQAFIPVNCGAIPPDLVENELFGHEPGAFTGAKTARPGLTQEADGGTLFLDEIDCLPLLAQVKLLRFLQEKEFRSLGSTKVCRANVRIIAATNADCEESVRSGKLRRDLYYRLNVIPLALPSLRERGEDVLLLARHFLVKHATELNKQIAGFSPNAIRKLYFYQWPGNVRELEHIIMRAVVLSDQAVIRADDITLLDHEYATESESFQQAKDRIVAEFETTYIRSLLLRCHGNISEAARLARKNRRAFWELIRKHHISVKSLRSSVSMRVGH